MAQFTFNDKNQIDSLIARADDNEETKWLISKFAALKLTRVPFFLTEDEFDEILRWKLRTQYGRTKAKRQKNTPSIIKAVTKAAFEIQDPDKDVEAYFKLRMLCTLVGVETAVASAILTLCYPNEFGVIDFRIWRQIFGERKASFTSSDYIKYISEIRKLSLQFGYTVQQIDQAIWQYDIDAAKALKTALR